MHRLKEILEKEFFKKGATNGQPTAELLSCIHNNHEEPNFVGKNQAFWIWEINNTQKYARCAHGARTDQATPPMTQGFSQVAFFSQKPNVPLDLELGYSEPKQGKGVHFVSLCAINSLITSSWA